MSIYLVTLEVNTGDGNFATFIIGAYSSSEKAQDAISNFDFSNLERYIVELPHEFYIQEMIIDK